MKKVFTEVTGLRGHFPIPYTSACGHKMSGYILIFAIITSCLPFGRMQDQHVHSTRNRVCKTGASSATFVPFCFQMNHHPHSHVKDQVAKRSGNTGLFLSSLQVHWNQHQLARAPAPYQWKFGIKSYFAVYTKNQTQADVAHKCPTKMRCEVTICLLKVSSLGSYLALSPTFPLP